MASKNSELDRAITEAINNSPPQDDKLTDAQKSDRARATTEYLARLSEEQARVQIRYRNERYRG